MPTKRDSDPVPKHLQMTKQVIDFGKYVIALIVGIAALGWMGHEYISQFQTETEATEAQQSNDAAHEHMQASIDTQATSLGNLRVYNVRIELEQRSTNDRLDQLLSLQTAENRREREDALDEVEDIQRRIDRRERVIRNPQALQRIADQVENDPLSGLDGL